MAHYRVRRRHNHAPGVVAPRNAVIDLDPADTETRRRVAAGLVVPTDEGLRGSLEYRVPQEAPQEAAPEPVAQEALELPEPQEAAPVVAQEDPAEVLDRAAEAVELTLEKLAHRVREESAAVLEAALELEQNGRARKGALEMIQAELETR